MIKCPKCGSINVLCSTTYLRCECKSCWHSWSKEECREPTTAEKLMHLVETSHFVKIHNSKIKGDPYIKIEVCHKSNGKLLIEEEDTVIDLINSAYSCAKEQEK